LYNTSGNRAPDMSFGIMGYVMCQDIPGPGISSSPQTLLPQKDKLELNIEPHSLTLVAIHLITETI
jgi:hypothetical protein